MTRIAHTAAFVASLVMTVGIFSSVSQLYTPAQTGAVLAAAQPAQVAQTVQPAQRS